MISTVSGGSSGGQQQLTEQPNSTQQQQQAEKSRWSSRLVIRNRNLALAVLCCCAFMQNVIVGGANNAILSTIEKAYYMTSVESAIFLTMYDVSNIIASPIIGYFGDRKQKPKIIAMSMLGLCLAACVMVLPQFAATNGNNNQTPTNTQTEEDNNNTSIAYLSDLMCNLSDSSTISLVSTTASSPLLRGSQSATNRLFNNMKYVFYLANLLNGVASVALYTIVISYIEGMFSKEQVHMRQGLYYAIGAIGVGVGMLATGNFLNISSSLLGGRGASQQSSSHSSNSVTWIGAWWLIYIPAALIDLTLAGLVFLFSPDLAVARAYHVSSMPRRRSRVSQPLKSHLADFARSARVILSNRVFVLVVLCTTTETFLIKGFSSYLAKYLEYQYRLAASTATMIVGALGFVSLMLGVFLGSFLVKHFKWQMRQCIFFITAILSLTCFLFFGLLISGPQETYVNGLHPTYIDSTCSCDPNTYYPVCYKNLYLFQTPCHAGCTTVTVNAKDYYGFTDCSVLDSLLLSSSSNASYNPSIYPCPRPNPRGYRNLAFISAFGFSILFLSSIIILPVLRVILESVSAENQSFALGIRSLVNKTLGNIPGPLMFAAIVDQSCIQWILNRNRTGKTCMLYNNSRFSMGLAFLGFSLRLCSAIFAILTLVQIRRGYEGSNSGCQPNRGGGVKSNLADEPDTKFSTTCDEQLATTSSSQMSSSTSSSRLAAATTTTNNNTNESFSYLNKAYAIDTSDDVLVFKSDGQQMTTTTTTTNDVPIEIIMPENQKSSSQI